MCINTARHRGITMMEPTDKHWLLDLRISQKPLLALIVRSVDGVDVLGLVHVRVLEA